MEPAEYDEMLRRIMVLTVSMGEMLQRHDQHLERLDASIVELKEFNRQQVEINADVRTTLARLETLLARMIPPSDNGRDA